MHVLITGHQGFVGGHVRALAGHLEERFGSALLFPASDLDICDDQSIKSCLDPLRFDAVLHLAAQSSIPASFADPAETFRVNVGGTVSLLNYLERRRFTGRLLLVSSGDVYGNSAHTDLPLTEATATRPANPYAASKLAAEVVAQTWPRWCPFSTVIARPFNHLGVGQSELFSVARFAASVARIVTGKAPPELATGRLDVTRDFLDVRDVIDAYFCLLRDGRAGETYNICSGIERKLGDVLQTVIDLSGVFIKTTIDPNLIRPVDLTRVVGSATKITADTGWRPRVAFQQTLADLFASHLETNSHL